MGVQFEAASWTIDIIPPWSAKDVGQCVEITQPEGTGALHRVTDEAQVLDRMVVQRRRTGALSHG